MIKHCELYLCGKPFEGNANQHFCSVRCQAFNRRIKAYKETMSEGRYREWLEVYEERVRITLRDGKPPISKAEVERQVKAKKKKVNKLHETLTILAKSGVSYRDYQMQQSLMLAGKVEVNDIQTK